MKVIGEHYQCPECKSESFNVILGSKKFSIAKIQEITCRQCGRRILNKVV